ncbi:alpha/beta hydrolase family protein [Amycolatopsis sulphurea]|uniref:Alpha/beta hydrolase family protein n=2 Tax=Amycolatopsis sulphurea TaxID=76022 RepID=A0A2A9FJA5_9PSEU|nr:alpha/beta hydrolase [Amycolatopsis sulphurea]PFG51013.1 alpha/beta hydrolase family protein [Amycolatopsis sulphurea]
MVSLADVRAWNPGTLDEICSLLQARTQVLVHDGDDYGKILPVEGWSGPAADNAAGQHHALMRQLDTIAAGAAAIGKAIGQASDAITGVHHALTNAEELARKYGFQITDAGGITDTYAGKEAPPEMHPEDRERTHAQLVDEVAQILRTANDIDTDLASVLDRAAAGQFGTGNESTVAAAAADGMKDPGLTLPEPPPNATPSQNSAWWATLSEAGRNILLRDHPDWLGNRDGLPGDVRSKANIARIPSERTDLQHQLDEAKKRLELVKDQPYRPPNMLPDALADIRKIEAKLASLTAIETTLAKGDRQLLTLDASGDRLKSAIAVGNVDTAKHVAVFTPGFTSTVDHSLAGYDTDMENLQKHTQLISSRYGDGAQAATVAWLGYEAPQNDDVINGNQSVASDHIAQTGAKKLDGFLNGIGASHEMQNQPLHLTALGHSYGSLTTGIALQQSTPVNDAVIFGSPGLDAQQRGDLQVPQGHLFSAGADQDSVPKLDVANHFGVSPYDMPGIDRLSTGDAVTVDGTPAHATHTHGQYLDDGSTSQYNMAAITAGRPDLRVNYVAPPPPPPPQQPTHR